MRLTWKEWQMDCMTESGCNTILMGLDDKLLLTGQSIQGPAKLKQLPALLINGADIA